MPTDSQTELRALDSVLSSAGFGRWSWDFDETLTLNAAACRILGLTQPQVAYKLADLLICIRESFHAEIFDLFEHSLVSGEPFDHTVELEPNGSSPLRMLRMRAELVVYDQPRRKCLIGVLEALPQNHTHTKSPAAFLGKEYWADTIDPLCLTCADGVIVHANPAWETALGFSSAELAGTHLSEQVHDEDLGQVRPVMSGLQTHAISGTLLSRFWTKDRKELWLRLTWTELPQQAMRAWYARDISKVKREENERLSTIESIRDSNEELQSFASVASHDLREPLRMISSYLRLLQERYPDALDARAQRYINYACEGADRMRILIEDLLTYARMGSQSLNLEPLSLDQVFDEVIDNLSASIKELKADVTIEVDQSPVVEGDPLRLVRLFQNLIANAMKFHAEGSNRRVQVSFEDGDVQGEPGCWIVHVQDNGIGVDPDHTELLFHAFQRLNTRDEFEGSGLGLAVCRKLAEQHGGRIWVKSTLGDGSCFSVSLKKAAGL